MGHLHHTEKENVLCFIGSTYTDEATLEGVTNPRTWASEHTHIISEALRNPANGSKLTVTVKVTITRYADYTHSHD